MHFALVLVIAVFCDATAADLLADLRKNLYQNNEDYILPSSNATTKRDVLKTVSKYREIKPPRKTEFVFPSIVRRMNDVNETQPEAGTKPDPAATNAVPEPAAGNTSTAHTRAQSAASGAHDPSAPALKPHPLIARRDEPRQSNEKESLQILNPMLAPKMRAAAGDRPALRRGGAQRMRARKHRALRGGGGGRGGRGGHGGRGGREGHVTAPREYPCTPRPDLMDMAPARGPRVHAKRLRNRLCARSVLQPEGPKYDSQGKIYLRKFTRRGRGHYGFNMTRPPALVLPRCCNCCRKSVLGCE